MDRNRQTKDVTHPEHETLAYPFVYGGKFTLSIQVI